MVSDLYAKINKDTRNYSIDLKKRKIRAKTKQNSEKQQVLTKI